MIVIDSSALVALLLPAKETGQLRARVTGEELHAPALLEYEVASAIRGITLGGQLDGERGAQLLEELDAVPIFRWAPTPVLSRRAFGLRHNVTAYDASYVALAEALECPLITRDAHLAHSHGHQAAIELH